MGAWIKEHKEAAAILIGVATLVIAVLAYRRGNTQNPGSSAGLFVPGQGVPPAATGSDLTGSAGTLPTDTLANLTTTLSNLNTTLQQGQPNGTGNPTPYGGALSQDYSGLGPDENAIAYWGYERGLLRNPDIPGLLSWQTFVNNLEGQGQTEQQAVNTAIQAIWASPEGKSVQQSGSKPTTSGPYALNPTQLAALGLSFSGQGGATLTGPNTARRVR